MCTGVNYQELYYYGGCKEYNVNLHDEDKSSEPTYVEIRGRGVQILMFVKIVD
jgi:hypothetical protein